MKGMIIMYGYIYITTNLVNGKRYIGQKTSSKFLGERYLGSGVLLNKAVLKYGTENFQVELLEECNSREELDKREIYWISYYDAVNSDLFYNLQAGGTSGNIKGSKLSDSVRARMSESHKGSNNFFYGKGYLLSGKNNPNYGNHKLLGVKLKEQHKLKISQRIKGRIFINNGIIQKRIYKEDLELYIEEGFQVGGLPRNYNHPFKGKIIVTNGIKDMHIDPNNIDEYIKNGYRRGSKTLGRKLTDEQKHRMSEYLKGVKRSTQAKQVMSKAAKLRFSVPSNNPMYGKKGENNPNYGKRFINNGKVNKMVNILDLDNYIKNGWKLGKIRRASNG